MFKAKQDSIIPIPSDERIKDIETYFKQNFPKAYIQFIKEYNGCIPITNKFDFPQEIFDLCPGEGIKRFLYLIDRDRLIYGHSNYPVNGEETGDYNILVVDATLESRITPPEYMDSYEYPLIPIALTGYHNYICLDYREDRSNPSICFWDNEDSKEQQPITTTISGSFEDFLNGLYE